MNESSAVLPLIIFCLDCPWRDPENGSPSAARIHARMERHRVSVVATVETIYTPDVAEVTA